MNIRTQDTIKIITDTNMIIIKPVKDKNSNYIYIEPLKGVENDAIINHNYIKNHDKYLNIITNTGYIESHRRGNGLYFSIYKNSNEENKTKTKSCDISPYKDLCLCHDSNSLAITDCKFINPDTGYCTQLEEYSKEFNDTSILINFIKIAVSQNDKKKKQLETILNLPDEDEDEDKNNLLKELDKDELQCYFNLLSKNKK